MALYEQVNRPYFLNSVVGIKAADAVAEQAATTVAAQNSTQIQHKAVALAEDANDVLSPAKDEAAESFRYKTGSLSYNFNGRKRILLSRIAEANDERIRRMRTAELENSERKYKRKIDDLRLEMEKADIHTQLLVCGVVSVQK